MAGQCLLMSIPCGHLFPLPSAAVVQHTHNASRACYSGAQRNGDGPKDTSNAGWKLDAQRWAGFCWCCWATEVRGTSLIGSCWHLCTDLIIDDKHTARHRGWVSAGQRPSRAAAADGATAWVVELLLPDAHTPLHWQGVSCSRQQGPARPRPLGTAMSATDPAGRLARWPVAACVIGTATSQQAQTAPAVRARRCTAWCAGWSDARKTPNLKRVWVNFQVAGPCKQQPDYKQQTALWASRILPPQKPAARERELP